MNEINTREERVKRLSEKNFFPDTISTIADLKMIKKGYINSVDKCSECSKANHESEVVFHMRAMDAMLTKHELTPHAQSSTPPYDMASQDLDAIHNIGRNIAAQCEFLGCEKPHDKLAQTTLLTKLMIGVNHKDAVREAMEDVNKIHLSNGK